MSVVEKKVRSVGFKQIRMRRRVFIIGMLSIAVLNFLVFWLYVNFNSILMAFQSQTKGGLVWTLDNFTRFFKEVKISDFQLGLAVKNSVLLYVSGTFFTLPLSLLFAYYLYKKVALSGFFRVVFFLPSIISAAVLVTLFKYVVMPSGPLNELLSIILGKDVAIEWVVDEKYSMFTILFYCVWTGFGGNIVLLTGAIYRIPEDVMEYGKLDGIGMTRELFSVIIPLIWPTLSTLIICSTAGLFTATGPVLLFTEGQFKTMTLGYFIFDKVQAGQYYYPSAIGLIFTFIGVPLTLLVKRVCDKTFEDVAY
ncbi:MAG: sugar ABC transporter permease [Firmicutes bacterium]|jgi:ABC transporter, permease protein|nr:sugar ABC transporter permease [Clostridia bacterium]MBS5023313.1 sugar ABC transporter permease [Bacillota bacterium]